MPRYDTTMTTFLHASVSTSALTPPTTTVVPATLPELPAGLTAADASRITEAISAARTESTRRLYALVWGQWQRWCQDRGVCALPGDPLALCVHLNGTRRGG